VQSGQQESMLWGARTVVWALGTHGASQPVSDGVRWGLLGLAVVDGVSYMQM
jgi:hypothetical protein